MKSYFCHQPCADCRKTTFLQLSAGLCCCMSESLLCVCGCVWLYIYKKRYVPCCVFFRAAELNVLPVGELLLLLLVLLQQPEVKNRKSLCFVAESQWCWRGAVVTGRSGWEPRRVGCRAVLTFAGVPLCGGDGSSGPRVFPPLPRHWPRWSELQAAQQGLGFLFKCVCVCVWAWGLINVVAIPLLPLSEWPP